MSNCLDREQTLHRVLDGLAQEREEIGRLLAQVGYPPLWQREARFSTLVHIILEQQVSLASAQAAFDRLVLALDSHVEPEPFLSLSDEALRAVGFSRQKARYGRCLATAFLDGTVDIGRLARSTDDEVRAELTAVKGIGNWTADVYLMMCLGRGNLWPVGDRALAVAVKEVQKLATVPKQEELLALGEVYRPWRTAVAFLYWHYYLQTR